LLADIPKFECDYKDMEEDNIDMEEVLTYRKRISILSNSNLGTVANNLATLSLIFSRRVDGADSEDLLILSASVDFRLFTQKQQIQKIAVILQNRYHHWHQL
jgi:hypothetical protein